MTGEDELAAWLRLLQTPGIGRETARRLLAACGSPAAVLRSDPQALRSLAGKAVAESLRQAPADFKAHLEAVRRWLAGGIERHVLTLDHPAWPPLLLQSADPPLLLYVEGDLAALSAPGLAVVGSRQPTPQGLDNARAFAAALAGAGLVVVSGLARGIDAAAHEGALHAGGRTVAVVGTGLDIVYPPTHAALARRIAAQGALVSEFPPGTAALPGNFPQRNRIIADLTQGTLVVEAALRSGSLITARLASEAGREVFAVPGSIHAVQSKGCHALIRQGATLVESAQDILDELRPGAATRPSVTSTPATGPESADPLLEALGEDPVTLDALMARTGDSADVLNARLLEFELAGHVSRLPGGMFQRRHAA